jgi:hypothetical protein
MRLVIQSGTVARERQKQEAREFASNIEARAALGRVSKLASTQIAMRDASASGGVAQQRASTVEPP